MTHFQSAFDSLHTTYSAFAETLANYPVDKHDQSGACGVWSPREVVAHLCGWMVLARNRYNQMLAGDTSSIYYDADTVNAASVTARTQHTWDDVVTELAQGVQQLIDCVHALPDALKVNDSRYREWLVGMAKEFRNHRADLERFKQTLDGASDAPILEFDPERDAIIHPSRIYKPLTEMPERVVFCFFQDVITAVCGNGKAQPIYHIGSEIGRNPIYVIEHEGVKVAVVHAGVGASLSGMFLEEMIALGGRKFIACGGAGVLDKSIAVGNVIVPEYAVRDEGTSYHYLPPGREVAADEQAVRAIKGVLARHHIPYLVGKTWTTDALYRETPHKVTRRRDEGCLTVEMEAAAFFAIAQFRGVQFGQLLYGGDDVSSAEWDHRGWMQQKSTREKLFWLAVEAVIAL